MWYKQKFDIVKILRRSSKAKKTPNNGSSDDNSNNHHDDERTANDLDSGVGVEMSAFGQPGRTRGNNPNQLDNTRDVESQQQGRQVEGQQDDETQVVLTDKAIQEETKADEKPSSFTDKIVLALTNLASAVPHLKTYIPGAEKLKNMATAIATSVLVLIISLFNYGTNQRVASLEKEMKKFREDLPAVVKQAVTDALNERMNNDQMDG